MGTGMTPQELELLESQYQWSMNAVAIKASNEGSIFGQPSAKWRALADIHLQLSERKDEASNQQQLMSAIYCLRNAWLTKQREVNRENAPPAPLQKAETINEVSIE
jgi:hypothetical protein